MISHITQDNTHISILGEDISGSLKAKPEACVSHIIPNTSQFALYKHKPLL